MSTPYAELHCHSYFSLLDGASSPEELVQIAAMLGLKGLALTDHDSLAGAVRFWRAAQKAGLPAILGAEVTLETQEHLTLLAETQTGYANLCRLITSSRLKQAGPGDEKWSGKVEPRLSWKALAEHADGLICLSGCSRGPVAKLLLGGRLEDAHEMARLLLDIFGRERFFIELQNHFQPKDARLIEQSLRLAGRAGIHHVATNNVHYATTTRSRLRDALIAIRHNQSLTAVRRAGSLPINSTYALTSGAEMVRRFSFLPDAVSRSVEIAERCRASVDFSHQRLPLYRKTGGLSEFEFLYQQCHQNLPRRYPTLTPRVLTQLTHELTVIEQANLAGYFLLVWDIVDFARCKRIRYQGRGSAANSIVAFLLYITPIDPLEHDLLFERFLSDSRYTTPDIDIDFDTNRREEVIQYIYQEYGAEHVGMVCNVVTYRTRSAVRDLGKALDLSQPDIERLIRTVDARSPTEAAHQIEAMGNEERAEETKEQKEASPSPTSYLSLLATLLRQISGCPRHLSIHNGGMLITRRPLSEVVPLEQATMPDRVVIQWDKNSVEDAGLIKLDILGLRALNLITDSLALVAESEGAAPDLDALPLNDVAVYQMIQKGDTIGASQVESRAQMSLAPRLKPISFPDLIVQVAIVRPGPIQAGSVHPFLARRAEPEAIVYDHPSLEPVLKETYGVMLFQEQAIRIAMVAGGFSAGEADMLRRALSRSDDAEIQGPMRQRFLEGAAVNGIDKASADAIFRRLSGFAGYGFCKSHSASLALVAYRTLWLKRYHPAAFYAALLNNQPMGFYSREVIINDARRHGVAILPPHVNLSRWHYSMERTKRSKWGLRVGLNAVKGMGPDAYRQVERARKDAAFVNLNDFCSRTRLPQSLVENLIRAGAMDEWEERRQLLWQLGGLNWISEDGLDLEIPVFPVDLPQLSELEETAWDYGLLGYSPGVQLMSHYREWLRRAGVLSTWQVKQTGAGRRVQVAGMVVIRQRPATAKGITFLSLEDESGLLDLVVKPGQYEKLRHLFQWETLAVFDGLVQRSQGATSVLVSTGRAI